MSGARRGPGLLLLLGFTACGGAGVDDGDLLGLASSAQVTVSTDWMSRLPTFPRFGVGETVQRWTTPGGRFAVYFSRQGPNQTIATDADADGVPDQVQAVGATAEAALSVYVDRLGFRPPLPSLDGSRTTIDLFLVDFASRGDGAYIEEGCRPGPPRVCQGLLLLENDFVGYRYGSAAQAARIVASHELFHAVQAAYDRPENSVLSEGSATWASEVFDPQLPDFERAIPAYLAATDQPLGVAPAGPVPPFAYGAALFFQFLSERHGERAVATLFQTLERAPGAENVPNPTPWVPGLNAALATSQATFAESFAEFARWNAVSGTATTPGYKNAASYPRVPATALTVPHKAEVRLFHSSAKHFVINTPAPGPLKVGLFPALAGVPLEVAVFAQVGTAAGTERPLLGRAGRELEVTPPAGTTALHLVVSHAAPSGSAARPTLCIGGEAEIAECRATVPEPAPTTPPPTAMPADDGGCRAAPGALPARGSRLAAVGLALLLASALRRRRR